MRTIALRFGEHFAPECGTIAAHQNILNEQGAVWYGKMGCAVSASVIDDIMKNEEPQILLIRSEKAERYWAYITEIKNEGIDEQLVPYYYRDSIDKFRTWFKIMKFENAEKDVLRKCSVASSGTALGEASKRSMSPYFIIDYKGCE